MAGVLWLMARLIDVDPYRSAVLNQLNRSLPVRIDAGRGELILVPYIGIRLRDVAVAYQPPGQPILTLLRAPRADVVLSWESLLHSQRKLIVNMQDPELDFHQLPAGTWDLEFLLQSGQTSSPAKSKPVAKPPEMKKSKVEMEIEARSKVLATGDFRTTPKSPGTGRVMSVPLNIPTPKPDRTSVFETLSVDSIHLRNSTIRIHPYNANQVTLQPKLVRVRVSRGRWEVDSVFSKFSRSPLANSLQICAGMSSADEESIAAILSPAQISVERWNSGIKGADWKGYVNWKGELFMQWNTLTLQGHLQDTHCSANP